MGDFSTGNEVKLREIIILLNDISRAGFKARGKFYNEELHGLDYFVVCYIERFVDTLCSINTLIANPENRIYTETSVGIIIRSSLLDLITIAYLYSYKMEIIDEETQEKFDTEFDKFMIDHIANNIKYFKTARDTGIATPDEYKLIIENLWSSYGFAFKDKTIDYDNPENKLISKEFLSPKQMFLRIRNHHFTKEYAKIYDLYIYYSKYDHFGIMTRFMLEQNSENFETFIYAMKFVSNGIVASSFLFSETNFYRIKYELDIILELRKKFDD